MSTLNNLLIYHVAHLVLLVCKYNQSVECNVASRDTLMVFIGNLAPLAPLVCDINWPLSVRCWLVWTWNKEIGDGMILTYALCLNVSCNAAVLDTLMVFRKLAPLVPLQQLAIFGKVMTYNNRVVTQSGWGQLLDTLERGDGIDSASL